MITNEIQNNIKLNEDDIASEIPISNELNSIPLRRRKRDLSRQGTGNCGNGNGGGNNSGSGNECGKNIFKLYLI